MVWTKRLMAPKFWPIKRKEKKFVVTPLPGAHKKNESISLGMLLRDFLKHAETIKEAKKILNSNLVKVDGVIRKDYRFSIGLMDVVSVGGESYRILPTSKGLAPVRIKKPDFKLSKIINKKILRGGRTQINLYDGKNIILNKDESNTADSMKTNDVLVIDLENNKIKDVLKFEESASAVVTHGSNIGTLGKIIKIIKGKSFQKDTVILKTDSKEFSIPKKYVFIIGKNAPLIQLGGNNE